MLPIHTGSTSHQIKRAALDGKGDNIGSLLLCFIIGSQPEGAIGKERYACYQIKGGRIPVPVDHSTGRVMSDQ
jgi:hypothetical protein